MMKHKFFLHTFGTIILFILLIVLAFLVDENGIMAEFNEVNQQILWQIRLPRIIAALASGAALALAGVLLQALLKNPLADPFILGVSGGGSIAALLVMLLGLSQIWVLLGAFSGALLSILLIYWLARSNQVGFAFRLILSGIILASLWGAIINFILLISPSAKLPSMLFWLMGDLSNLSIPWILCTVLLLSSGLILWFSHNIDLLLYGEDKALSLGLDLAKIQWLLLIISSVLVASVVSTVGNIGFVGLVVPHIVRLLGKRQHRSLVPNSIILGATILMMADWLSRIIMAPTIIPVGILTTIIGVPLFVYLLRSCQFNR